MSELDPLLSELRASYEPDGDARERVRRRLTTALSAGGVLLTSATAASAVASPTTGLVGTGVGHALGSGGAKVLGASLSSLTAGTKLAIGLGIGVATSFTGGMLWTEFRGSEIPSVTTMDQGQVNVPVQGRRAAEPNRGAAMNPGSATPGTEATSTAITGEAGPEDTNAGPDATTTPPATRRTAAAPRSGPSRHSAVLEDLRLLEAASQALRGGETLEAREILDEHARRFPRSVVADERTGLNLLASCDGTSGLEARREAERFLETHPGSPLAEHVRKRCLP